MKKNKKVVMVIMDGWGLGKKDKFNAIDNAKTPNVDMLVREYPNVSLRSDGKYVGLPDGQFGTSEINHQVIGIGRTVLQDLPKIDKEIEEEAFFANPKLVELCKHVNASEATLHLVGIISDGKVHASMSHIFGLIKLAANEKVKNLSIHAFTDGRDTPPKSAKEFVDQIETELKKYKFEKARIASIQGRFFLDRDREWSRTDMAIDLIVRAKGRKFSSAESAINFYYNQNITDEFFNQVIIDETGVVGKNDGVIFFHYRSDRMYQIQKKLLEANIENLKIVSFISAFEDNSIAIAFPRPVITQTLARSISEANKTQLHITETEKFTHLTFFLNAGREEEYQGEVWDNLQSNRFVKPFYNFDPLMQGDGITKKVIEAVENDKYDFIIVNFANADMVGHTGNYEAAVVAAEGVDHCVGELYKTIKEKLDDYALLVTADHGNSDEMWDYEANQPHTQHTTNPVPFVLVSDLKCSLAKRESLEDIAPTILELMGIEVPETMTGTNLIIEN